MPNCKYCSIALSLVPLAMLVVAAILSAVSAHPDAEIIAVWLVLGSFAFMAGGIAMHISGNQHPTLRA